ncbi:hypothetical protein chiPu_0002089 [Chiloscyllium punctatum]|uniref:Uncharacterized protein n=1 Tax=Chiloscyllium punctatum TaxID=137246 RepID=A0A401RZV9_CHIPU|nr:hypothetical protein [Chiloscyllium punctatum]
MKKRWKTHRTAAETKEFPGPPQPPRGRCFCCRFNRTSNSKNRHQDGAGAPLPVAPAHSSNAIPGYRACAEGGGCAAPWASAAARTRFHVTAQPIGEWCGRLAQHSANRSSRRAGSLNSLLFRFSLGPGEVDVSGGRV